MSSSGGGPSGDIIRVSIPSNVRKTIQNIKEITGSHSEEDIYAMLKDCSMDPNETAQKLLLQDTFHEVKRKRDRKKENLNKEPAEPRWKPGVQGRGSRGSRGIHSSSNISHDNTAGRKKSASAKENGPYEVLDKGVSIPFSNTSSETKGKEADSAASSLAATTNGPTAVASRNMIVVHGTRASTFPDNEKLEEHLSPSANASEIRDQFTEQMADSSNCSTSMTSTQPSGAYFLSSDPVVLSLQESRHSSVVNTTKHEGGDQCIAVEQISAFSDKIKSTSGPSESGCSNVQGKMPSKAHGNVKNPHLDSLHTTGSIHAGSAVSRPSSNYSNRSQVIGPQKAGPNKEWKPKSTIPNLTRGFGAAASSEAHAISAEVSTKMAPALNALDSKEANVKLQRKLEELHVSDGQHVIIPHHLHVPEAEKLGFCFGSFDASFGIKTSCVSTPENDQSASLSETSDGNEEAAEEQFSSNQSAFVVVDEVNYPENNQSSSDAPENLSSGEGEVPSSLEYDKSKQESTLGGNQYSLSHTSPNYSFGFMPPIVGSQLATFESSESQPRDVTRLPTFVVQQPFDPTSYYEQFYRSGADSDGRISPFHSAGVATKYTGNFAMLSPQTSQSPQEANSPLVLSTAAPTPLITQAASVMQSSMAVTQQPLSVFRPPAGLHLPHYPSNYIPYGHYISPFYVPPPAIHQFLSNGAFPQQPQGSNVYPAPPAAAAKYPLPQYKPGTNPNNSSHVGIPGSYMPYGSSMATYHPNAAAAAGNSTSNEDLATSHLKENNVYGSSQQSEGSGVWIPPPGRDFSSLQASSFYNLPQGQMAFAPAQPGHGTFPGIYHPAQPVNATTVNPLLQQSQTMASPLDVIGPTASAYQQPQHSQINWPNNF